MAPRNRFSPTWLLLSCLAFAAPLSKGAVAASQRILGDSVRLPDAGGLSIGRARITRAALTPSELAETVDFSVSLRMRDLAGLQERVSRGEQVPEAEMESSYRPLLSDYDRVASWLSGQGFQLTLADRTHTIVFARGRVSDLSRVLGAQFSRVRVSEGDYTSAVTAPAVPAELAGVILGVNGLQPQFRLRHVSAPQLSPRDSVGGQVYVTPDNVVSAYDIPSSATGAGQIIAVVGEANVLSSDLTKFWSTAQVAQTASNVTTISVNGGAGSSPGTGLVQEASLDVEWAGALAPGAAIRYYVAPEVLECISQIINDHPGFPAMSVVSMSFGDTEADQSGGALQTLSQQMATLAAAGVTVFAASGDEGSNPTPGGSGGYSASEPLAVDYPASDPSVTGVGGTTLTFTGNWSYSGEVVWNEISSTQSASGGGLSAVFAKPSWQTGSGVLSGQSMRCVPDVAALSNSNLMNVNLGSGFLPENASGVGVLVYVNGQPEALGGTSLACPVWAAIGALINQERASSGAAPIGLLNPHLYPLAGAGVFNDVTSGTNGAYSAGPGYDLCTGLGSPDAANLIAALSGASAPPPGTHRLNDISTRAEVESGANILIAGFSIDGPAGTNKSVLVRGIGPALAADFGVSGTLAQPVLEVYDANSVLIATDEGWGNFPTAGTSPVIASFRKATSADMQAAGAFQLSPGSADSAMVITLPTGNYTVEVVGAGATTGVALGEVYDLDGSATDLLGNVSSRCFVGTGSGVAICGFAIGGTQPMQVLVRGIGPALSAFGLSNLLEQPSIGVFDGNSVLVASDTGWGNAPVAGTSPVSASYRMATAADLKAAGAFALPANSPDCALVLTLPPGNYTVVVSGVNNTTGTALAEVYQMD